MSALRARHLAAFTSPFFVLAFVSAFCCATLLLLPARAIAASPLDTLQKQHPRLFLHDSDIPALQHTIATDPFAKQQFDELKAYADQLLTTPPDVYFIGGVEHTLLETSRDMEGRVFALAGMYRLTGDLRYADRATREMLAAAAFPDWYPTHFLDTGEMTATLGLGYDWLYPVLSPADRATIKNAMPPKASIPGSRASKTAKRFITSTTTGTRSATAVNPSARSPSPTRNPSAPRPSSTTPTPPSPTSCGSSRPMADSKKALPTGSTPPPTT